MKRAILVAGATGDLGGRVVKALLKRNAEVRAVVRFSSDEAKVDELVKMGVKVIKADMSSLAELTEACKDVACVVSTLAGLREVIVDGQSVLLDAAIAAGVPRFISSDFASDFTKLPEGENRNFDLRKEFHKKLDQSPISRTSIMIGAFADILSYNTPFYNVKENMVSYWGSDAEWQVDFTTKDNTADYTAAAALDPSTPKILRIASFRISPKELAAMATEIKNTEFRLVPMGTLESLSAYNKKERAAHPEGENELYPKWQGSQYMHSMFSVHNEHLDNDRYNDIKWTSAMEVISAIN